MSEVRWTTSSGILKDIQGTSFTCRPLSIHPCAYFRSNLRRPWAVQLMFPMFLCQSAEENHSGFSRAGKGERSYFSPSNSRIAENHLKRGTLKKESQTGNHLPEDLERLQDSLPGALLVCRAGFWNVKRIRGNITWGVPGRILKTGFLRTLFSIHNGTFY